MSLLSNRKARVARFSIEMKQHLGKACDEFQSNHP